MLPNAPYRPTMVPSAVGQRLWSPRMHCRQPMQLFEYHPSPTRSPAFTLVTREPTAFTVPAASCPGTNGYLVMPQSLSSMERSEWQRPQCDTAISTSSSPSGPGSYSNGFNSPFGWCAANA